MGTLLFLGRGEQLLGLLEAPETDEGECTVGKRAPRLGQHGCALSDRDPRGRNEKRQRLVHAPAASQALAQQGVQTGALPPVRRRELINGAEDGRRADGACLEAEPPSREFVVPDPVQLRGEEVVELFAVGCAAQQQVVVEAEKGHPNSFDGIRRVEGQRVELPGRLLVSAGHGGGLRRQQASLEPLSCFDGGTSEALGQFIVAALPGRLGAIDEKIGASVATDELQLGAQQRVVLAPAARCLCELPGQQALAAGTDACTHDIAIDGMGETDLESSAVDAAGQQTSVLERRDGSGVGQLVECRLRQRLPESSELEGMTFRIGQSSPSGS